MRRKFLVACLVGLAAICGFLALRPNEKGPAVYRATGFVPPKAGFISHRSAEHGFTFEYPSGLDTTTAFSSVPRIGNGWRYGDTGGLIGKPVVGVIVERIPETGGDPVFGAEFRVGFAEGADAVRDCYVADDASAAAEIETVNGTAFHVIDLQSVRDGGYALVRSFRAVHDGKCFALETLISGNNSADEREAAAERERIVKDQIVLENIVKTFTF